MNIIMYNAMDEIGIFISHSWHYSNHYEQLSKWFKRRWKIGDKNHFQFIDYSIPKDDPIHNTSDSQELLEAIYFEIEKAQVLISLTGMYTKYSRWIKREIIAAEHLNHKILGVNPWGQERKSVFVADHADKIVGWTEKSVVGGVWGLYIDGR